MKNKFKYILIILIICSNISFGKENNNLIIENVINKISIFNKKNVDNNSYIKKISKTFFQKIRNYKKLYSKSRIVSQQ